MVEYRVKVSDEKTEWRNLDGELHRLDGPAREYKNGTKEWWNNGKLNRDGGPAIEYDSGTKHWYNNDKLHRLDGPAIETEFGDKEWYQNDVYHRLDGPAVELADGKKYCYINGERLTEEEFIIKTQSKKEMTMAELEKQLGFSVKIVK